jgi:hypothetical protein
MTSMPWNSGLTKLQKLLAELYPDQQSAKEKAALTPLRLGRIEFTTVADSNWFNILSEADGQKEVSSLVQVACDDFPNRCHELTEAYEEFRQQLPARPFWIITRRPQSTRTLLAVGGFLVLLIICVVGWAGYEWGKRSCSAEEVYTVPVFADKLPFEDTGIQIEAGNELSITVLGEDAKWTCSTSHINDPEEPDWATADGIPNFKRTDRLVSSANLCEMVGQIQDREHSPDGTHFRVGVHEQFVAKQTGMLYLGVNDDRNYYDDNSGSMTVEIRLRR